MIWPNYGAIQNVRHSGKRGGEVEKKEQKSDVVGGVSAKKMWCYSLKKQDFASDVMLTYFSVSFMGVFVDDVISFLWNK